MKEGGTLNRSTTKPTSEEIMEEIKELEEAPPLSPKEIALGPKNMDGVLIRRRTRRIKGSWRQIPK
jgi:hypothetical protein